MFYYILLIFIFQYAYGSYHEQYRVPQVITDKIETYIFNDKQYIIQNLPARWEDALIICRGRHNGSLAVLDNIEKAEFLAEAMSESQFYLDSIWVGARRESAEDPEGYRWVSGSRLELRRTANDVMNYHEDEKQPMEFHYPSWQNRTHVPVPEGGADCVAISRMFHEKPLFLDLPCEVDRPFVCEKAAESQLRVVQLKTVRCKTGLYHLYDGRMTWDQAAAHCVLSKMTLAHIVSMRCLKKLGVTMLKSRPSIETAWIGARGELGKWTWIDDGRNIFLPSPMLDADPSVWPPMRDRNAVKQNGCLQLDRHISHMPVFLEARCERKMQFICYETKEGTPGVRASTEMPNDDFYYYFLVRQKLFWGHAYDNCIRMKAILASVENPEVITQLLLLMGENKDLLTEGEIINYNYSERHPVSPLHPLIFQKGPKNVYCDCTAIGHVWVSGRLNLTKDLITDTINYVWYNPSTGLRIPDKSMERSGDAFVPPWLDDEFTTDNSCLNLDRENHLSGMIYGIPCDTPQYSICMIPKNIRGPISMLKTKIPDIVDNTTQEIDAVTVSKPI